MERFRESIAVATPQGEIGPPDDQRSPVRCPACSRTLEAAPLYPVAQLTLGDLWDLTKSIILHAWVYALMVGVVVGLAFAVGWGVDLAIGPSAIETWWDVVPGWIRIAALVGLGLWLCVAGHLTEAFTKFGGALVQLGWALERGSFCVRLGKALILVGTIAGLWFSWWATLIVVWVVFAPAEAALTEWRRRVPNRASQLNDDLSDLAAS